MPKPVSLSVHRNKSRERRAKTLRSEIKRFVNGLPRTLHQPLSGYAVVVWDCDGNTAATWDRGKGMGVINIADHVDTVFRRHVVDTDVRYILDEDNNE